MIGLKKIRKKLEILLQLEFMKFLKTGVKVAIDQDKKLIVTIRKMDLAKDMQMLGLKFFQKKRFGC